MTDEAWERLAGLVRVRRRSLGLTQAELAAAAGVSEPTIRVLETARRLPKPGNLRDIARALGWTDDSLQQIIDGGDPVAMPTGRPPDDVILAEVARLRARIEQLEAEVRGQPADGNGGESGTTRSA